MGVTKVEVKDYTITRYSFWKFWRVDELEFNLPKSYTDAYEEVERKTMNGRTWSMELMDWVKDDIRNQLSCMIIIYPDLVTKAKKLKVRFRSWYGNSTITSMNFYIISGDIYFDSDEMVKREKLLNKLGI